MTLFYWFSWSGFSTSIDYVDSTREIHRFISAFSIANDVAIHEVDANLEQYLYLQVNLFKAV